MKNRRHKCILDLINNSVMQTQEDLVEGLKAAGFDCTQGTVSRDIRELRLMKVLDHSGVYKYALPKEGSTYLERLKEVFAQSVLSVVASGNLIIIKTIPAGAAAAANTIDTLDFPDILGCIAGDDTVFVALADTADSHILADKFIELARL